MENVVQGNTFAQLGANHTNQRRFPAICFLAYTNLISLLKEFYVTYTAVRTQKTYMDILFIFSLYGEAGEKVVGFAVRCKNAIVALRIKKAHISCSF
jgi:hypothetical protein